MGPSFFGATGFCFHSLGNLPGADRERPNWRRRLAVAVEDLAQVELAAKILAKIRAARATPLGGEAV